MKIIAGNWKMNMLKAESEKLIKDIIPFAQASSDTVVAFVPFVYLETAISLAKGTKLKIGAQNVHWAENGAFTGEISAQMLVDIGAEYALIGHSERRQFFGETDKSVNGRLLAALKCKLKPIVCIGETLIQRQSDQTEQILNMQLKSALEWIEKAELPKIVIAYEPVWAIGTGITATSEQADKTIEYMKNWMIKQFGVSAPVLYGGSMNEINAAELLAQKHIDGGLIGGASLSSSKFGKIINAK